MNKNDFFKRLMEIDGVGDSKAQALYDAGYTSIEKLEESTIGEIAKIEGISRRIAKNILSDLFPEKFEEKHKAAAPAKRKKSAEESHEETKEAEEETEIVEEVKEVQKIKPELPDSEKRLMDLKLDMARKQPAFLRQEWFRYSRLGKKWRKPRGLHSKMRKNMKYRPPMARVGYGKPAAVRGRHPSGFEEIIVHNVRDVEDINPAKEAVRIASAVGYRKRKDILILADEKNIRVLNRGGE